MKVLLVGGGGREHALAWKLRNEDPMLDLLAAPGNPGIAEVARCVSVPAADITGLVALAEQERPGLTVVGPEAPLAAGIADRLSERGFRVFGPSAAAARIESSKAFAKELMRAAAVPTAAARVFTDSGAAKAYARQQGAPIVIKASGLAAGKGVTVCTSIEQADQAIDAVLTRRVLGAAGNEILVEEFMAGEELSVLAISDGERFVTLLPVRDHKRLGEGDTGPNTGGMGAYAPVSGVSADLLQEVGSSIVAPALAALRARGTPFRGVLYAGLMLTKSGPRVVEFNCRFGDPETQVILPLMESPLLPLLESAASAELDGATPRWSTGCTVTTVVAAPGYPEAPQIGDRVTIPEVRPGVIVFHAGTARDTAGNLISSGGRVLSVTGVGASVHEAASLSREFAEQVGLEGKQMRRDIGWRS